MAMQSDIIKYKIDIPLKVHILLAMPNDAIIAIDIICSVSNAEYRLLGYPGIRFEYPGSYV